MNEILTEITGLLKMLAQDSSSASELLSVWLSMFVAGITGIVFVGKGMKGALAYSYPRALIIWAICFGGIAAGLAAGNLYILPRISSAGTQNAAQAAIALLIIVAVAAPVCTWLHKTKYSSAVFTLLISILFSVAAMYLVRGGFNAARTGKASAVKSKTQTESVREIFKDSR